MIQGGTRRRRRIQPRLARRMVRYLAQLVRLSILSGRNIRLLFSVFLTTQPTDQQPQGRAFMPSFAYVAQDGARRVAARDDSGPDAANGNPSVPGSPAATPSTSAPLPTPTPESRDVKPPVSPPAQLPVSPPSPPVEPPVKPPADKVPAKPAN